MAWAKTLTFTPGFSVVRVQETLTDDTSIGNAGTFYSLGLSQRPAYRFQLKLGPLEKTEVECLMALYNYHRISKSFFWDGHPYNTLENFVPIGEADGTRREYFLFNNYINPSSISVQITSGNGNSAVTTSFTLAATPGIVTLAPTIIASGFQVDVKHSHQYRVFFGSELRVSVQNRGIFYADMELMENKISVPGAQL